jgi:segregation and condensation protein A
VTASVRELELDLDAFEGPFDLLLTLVLKEALEPAEVDVAAIVVAFVERLAEREQLDLDACGEFLVLVAALLELKARGLFPDEEAELAELEPEEAAEELARRLAEYRRMKEAAAWLRERLEAERDRYFRLGPAPLAPVPERRLAPQPAECLAEALRALAVEPPQVTLTHMALRFPPVTQFVERFRALLGRRRRFDFDAEVAGLSRVEQAVAFLALLELHKAGEASLAQAAPFAPIRVSSRPWSAAAHAGRSPAPPPPDVADEPMPSGAVLPSTVPSGLGSSATPQEREAGVRRPDLERSEQWRTVRSA